MTVTQSIAFLIFVAPLCIYVAWNDLRAMKIPTWSTDALAIVFVVVGIFVMPFRIICGVTRTSGSFLLWRSF